MSRNKAKRRQRGLLKKKGREGHQKKQLQGIISKDFELSLNIKKYHNMFIDLTA
ncbi:hypothetical protein RSJ42_00750 [Methanosarcina hadiensis]|uniref:hypothetical protein n=1 Tax=Methanosarcina hadiensis TaxID=3078083 RepID=UPI003977589A